MTDADADKDYLETRPVQPPYTAEETGSPGSPLAVNNGCTCAVIDNNHGQGFLLTRDGVTRQSFWISGDCPLHGVVEAENDPED